MLGDEATPARVLGSVKRTPTLMLGPKHDPFRYRLRQRCEASSCEWEGSSLLLFLPTPSTPARSAGATSLELRA